MWWYIYIYIYIYQFLEFFLACNEATSSVNNFSTESWQNQTGPSLESKSGKWAKFWPIWYYIKQVDPDSCVLRLLVHLSYILLEKALKTPINPTSPRGLTGKLNIHVTFCLVVMYPLWHIIWIKILCPSIFHVFFI
jgi:hypothetical protein